MLSTLADNLRVVVQGGFRVRASCTHTRVNLLAHLGFNGYQRVTPGQCAHLQP